MSTNLQQNGFEDPVWFNALTLSERAALMRLSQFPQETAGENLNRATRLLQRWRSQRPFTIDDHFVARLETEHLNEGEFLQLLSARPDVIHRSSTVRPDWLIKLETAFHSFSQVSLEAQQEAGEHHVEQHQAEGQDFLLSWARNRVITGIREIQEKYTKLPFDPDKVDLLFLPSLSQEIAKITSRVMVLELNVARLNGVLEGDTPQARFNHFLRRVRQPQEFLNILKEYPVLARHLVATIDHWVTFTLEFLNHLCADWLSIMETLSPATEPGLLSSLHIGSGDRHREGRSVVIATFSSGFKAVYKPRSLSVDVHFSQLLEWLNERGDHPKYQTLRVIDRPSHGWVEFVETRGCETVEQVRRFYERQGGYLALLYMLEATDFHLENLMACGEDPYLIDLEALFHPRPSQDLGDGSSFALAARIMSHSVLRVGLLPQRMWTGGNDEGIEMSGLGGAAGQLTPHALPMFEQTGTDEMRLVRKRIPLPGSQNRATFNEVAVDARDYLESIVKGFSSVYRLLCKYRDDLLRDDSPLSRFSEDEVRVVLRPTRTYGLILTESYHPDVLRTALDRDRLLDRLWVEVEFRPHLEKVIPAEHADLSQGDIPVFTTRPGSRALWTSKREVIPDFFEVPSLEMVHHRLKQMGDDDLARQEWFIRGSMTALDWGHNQERQVHYRIAQSRTAAGRDSILEAAREVGDRLEMLAIRDADFVSWMGLTMIKEKAWSLLPLGDDLYGGTTGIGLFLSYLGAVTGEARYTNLARAIVGNLRKQIKNHLSLRKAAEGVEDPIGAFGGLGGAIYSLSHFGTLWRDPSLLADAEGLVDHLVEIIPRDQGLDIIGGAAGCIAALLSLHRCTASEQSLSAAVACANRLVSTARSMPVGVGWSTAVDATQPLTGFSHGAAGIAWALLEVAARTADETFTKVALEAISYERSVFSQSQENWPDFRNFNLPGAEASDQAQLKFSVTWCHGAPGTGLARLRSLAHVDTPEITADINAAVNTTIARGFGGNHSLCHGDLGNLDFLLDAALTLDNTELSDRVYRIAGSILESTKTHGWLCGVPSGVETPGLLTGLAGIGYELLRLAEPDRVPSLLTLAPPKL
ncbi:MAG TPA: type 2 lanthipeptide synthetase LanM family protein [Blastocatellia bacterium]|nr:type 2 lanthipeptide synthetase LanM family protein [Blastocatellia bacterium]